MKKFFLALCLFLSSCGAGEPCFAHEVQYRFDIAPPQVFHHHTPSIVIQPWWQPVPLQYPYIYYGQWHDYWLSQYDPYMYPYYTPCNINVLATERVCAYP